MVFDSMAFQAGIALIISAALSLRLMKNFPKLSKWILIIAALPITLAAIGSPASTVAGSAITLASYLAYRRYAGTALSSLADLVTIRFWRTREERTDVRTAGAAGLRAKNGRLYDPERFLKIASSRSEIFLGLDKKRRPVNLKLADFKKSHIQILGTTGAGKTVAATSIMAQLIRAGISTIAFDPKNDEFLGRMLSAEAEKNGRRFFYFDLRANHAAWNPFYGKNAGAIEELLGGGLALANRGDNADFYRAIDRELVRDLARYAEKRATDRPDLTAYEVWREFSALDPERRKTAQKISIDLDELLSIPFCNATSEQSVNFLDEIQAGSVFYIWGTHRVPKILTLQKILLLDIMMQIENRSRDGANHCSIFLDEFKYLLTAPSMQALGTIRDKKCNLLIAHQSMEDCRDVGADLNPDAVIGAVIENCRIKIAYESSHFETLDMLSKLSGTILIEDETKKIQRNIALGEEGTGERSLKINDRPLIDLNHLRTLPKKHAVLFGLGLAQIIAIENLPAPPEIRLLPWGVPFSPSQISQDADLIAVESPSTDRESPAEESLI